MADCRVYRRHGGQFAWALNTNRVHAVRGWVADCPHCGEEITWRGSYPTGGPTRKNTKDALHQHIKARHS